MSREKAEAFIARVQSDESVRKRLDALSKTDRAQALADVVAAAAELGYQFSASDYEAAVKLTSRGSVRRVS